MYILKIAIAPVIFALIIPLAYCHKWKKESLERVVVLSLCILGIVGLYPAVNYLAGMYGDTGYFLGKFILFTLLPFAVIAYFERWNVRDALKHFGVRKERVWPSIFLGIGALVITLLISLAITWGNEGITSLSWNAVMFFDAFNEEFLLRGVLFLYLWKLTELRIAYATSITAFIFAHPQNFESLFIIATAAQGILLMIVTRRTGNILGPWISHGLNRTVIQVIRALLF